MATESMAAKHIAAIADRVAKLTLEEYAIELADALDAAMRVGARSDEQEGARFIKLSDSLAREISETLRSKARR